MESLTVIGLILASVIFSTLLIYKGISGIIRNLKADS